MNSGPSGHLCGSAWKSGREGVREVPCRAARGVQLPSPYECDVLVWFSQADVFLKLQECTHTIARMHSCSSVVLLSSPDCNLVTFILNSLDFHFNTAKNWDVTYFFWQVSASSRTSYFPPISCLLILHSLPALRQ